jgi:hypothetical protein
MTQKYNIKSNHYLPITNYYSLVTIRSISVIYTLPSAISHGIFISVHAFFIISSHFLSCMPPRRTSICTCCVCMSSICSRRASMTPANVRSICVKFAIAPAMTRYFLVCTHICPEISGQARDDTIEGVCAPSISPSLPTWRGLG